MKHETSSKGLTWINVQSPTPEELAEFVREAGVTPVDGEFIAQGRRPEVAIRIGYILILISVPVFDRSARITRGAALFLVVAPQRVFSLHYEPIVVLDRLRQAFVESPARMEEYFANDALSLALHLLQSLYEGAFRKLDRLGKHIDIAEDAVFQGNEHKMVEEISVLTRDVMDFRKIIRPQRHLFSQLPRHALVTAETAATWYRVGKGPEKMWEILEGMLESVKEIAKTNFTLLQYKENELLRVLTIYSIIAVPAFLLVAPLNLPDLGLTSPLFYAFLGLVCAFTIILIFIFLRSRR